MYQILNTRLIALQCSNAVKSLLPHYFNKVFTSSQKYIFNVHQIITFGGKFNIFLARTRTKKYNSECTKTRNLE